METPELYDANRKSVQIPKLKFRQSTYNADTASTTSAVPSIPTISTSSAPSDFCPSPRYPVSEFSAPPSPRPASSAPSAQSAPPVSGSQTADKKKKKQNFFTSLFAKEPSSQALADYERQLKEQGALKDGKLKAVGMPMVSSSKLPPTVPKVNSKWDGTPQGLIDRKDQEKKIAEERFNMWNVSKGSSHSGSSETSSLRTSSRRPQSKGTLGGASMRSAYSGDGKNQLAELYGWELSASSSNDKLSRPDTGGSSIRSVPNMVSGIATEPSQPPEIPKEYFERPPVSRGSSFNPPTHSHSPSLTPYDPSPRTPDAPLPLPPNSGSSEKTLYDPKVPIADDIRTTTIEVPQSQVVVKSKGPNILGPPVSARRKPKDGQTEPVSILKKKSAPSFKEAQQHEILPKSAFLPSTSGPLDYQKSPLRRRSTFVDNKVAPWEEPPSLPAGDERNVTPTPESGAPQRRSRWGFPKK